MTWAITARRTRRGWTFECSCGRGYMTRGPMQLHLMARAHGATLSEAGRAMDAAQREGTCS